MIKYYCDICKAEMARDRYHIQLKDITNSIYKDGIISDKMICEDCFNKFKKEVFEVIA